MKNQIIPFSFGAQEIRSLLIDGEPWFVAKDACDVLEIQNVTQAVNALDEDERSMFNIGRQGTVNIVSESGLYALIFKSRKPQARAFRKWVTAEVLPALRKHGHYATPGRRRRFETPEGFANRADIFHHRGPVSKSGLDIRYTLDLTKIVTNPNPRGLELVQRLTGVEMDDLIKALGARRSDWNHLPLHGLFERFAAERLLWEAEAVTPFARIHRAFQDWFRAADIDRRDFSAMPSAKALALWLRGAGCVSRRPGGVSTIYGARPA